MGEGIFHKDIVPWQDTNGEDPSCVVWLGCLLCYEVLPSLILYERSLYFVVRPE
jgi:hypothetical protein